MDARPRDLSRRDRSEERRRRHRSDSPLSQPDAGRGMSREARKRFRFDSPPKPEEQAAMMKKYATEARLPPKPRARVPEEDPSTRSKIARLFELHRVEPEDAMMAKHLAIGNLPPSLTKDQLLDFMNAALIALRGNMTPGKPVVSCEVSEDPHTFQIQLRNFEETNNALVLNGISCLGYTITVERPKAYNKALYSIPGSQMTTLQGGLGLAVAQAAGTAVLSGLGANMEKAHAPPANSHGSMSTLTSSLGLQCAEACVVCNLPPVSLVHPRKIFEMLTSFGLLVMFHYISFKRGASKTTLEPEEGDDAAMAVFAFADNSEFAGCREFLDGLSVSGSRIKVIRAERALELYGELQQPFKCLLNAKGQLPKWLIRPARFEIPSRCLWLANVLTWDQARSDDIYFQVVEDVEIEIEEVAEPLEMRLPRPAPGHVDEEQTEVGSAFMKFVTVQDAMNVKKFVDGRKFDERVVRVHFFSEVKFGDCDFKYPTPLWNPHESCLFDPKLKEEAEQARIDRDEKIRKEIEAETERRRREAEKRRRDMAEAEMAAAEEMARRRAEQQAALADLAGPKAIVNRILPQLAPVPDDADDMELSD
ncbi:MAG: uncharacterized protein KVP18_001091 [Porospora cf. gigantea A]|uniref:uncharacterized protein n=1 Tax=Porospora cf. gigantea A TaxID=2853593 RepID=UPI00355A6438|nr:MAG: hypothetical protein KVP18_001091 [Porospora cf. gigantea A]